MATVPNYSTYSLKDLLDVERNINREAFPDRYRQVLIEIQKREDGIWEEKAPAPSVVGMTDRSAVAGESTDDELIGADVRVGTPFTTMAFKGIALYQLVAGLVGLVHFLIMYFGAAPVQPTILSTIMHVTICLLSCLAGVLLWRQPHSGTGMSMLVQAVQIPSIATASFSLFLSVLPWHFVIPIGTYNDSRIGLNLVALVVLLALVVLPKDRAKRNEGA